MILESIPVGPGAANCYVYAPADHEAVIIDPGGDAERIVALVTRLGVAPRAVVNTHGHIDHIGANGALAGHFAVPILIHREDGPYLLDAERNLSALFGLGVVDGPPADRLLEDGDTIVLDGHSLEVLHTPGHTPGGVCLLDGEICFSGDTLFHRSLGRSDLPGGHGPTLLRSIRDRLLVLSGTTVVYPGHEGTTTIAEERRENPYL